MKSFVELELSELSINSDLLKNTRLARLPTWEELFESIHRVVQSEPARLYHQGAVVLDFTTHSVGRGRCFHYACLTWASLQLLVKGRTGVNMGGIAIKTFNKAKGHGALALPRDPKNPNASGGYHAWCVLERTPGVPHPTHDDVLILDFSYHWFKTAVGNAQTIVGPDQFLVASPSSLLKRGIAYHANDHASELVTSSLDLNDYRDEVLKIFTELKLCIGSA